MDDPALDPLRHVQALRGLERINRWSRSAEIVWSPIRALGGVHPLRPVRILDVATGAGDLPIALWRSARRAALPLAIDGCDRSPRAVAYARVCAERAGAAVRFFERDALTDPLPTGYDVLISSLFLHHLDELQGVALLRNMAHSAARLVLVSDLVRSPVGFGLAYVGTRLLSASPVVRTDGPRSVRAAWTLGEVRALAVRAGLKDAMVSRRWPCRFLLAWQRG